MLPEFGQPWVGKKNTRAGEKKKSYLLFIIIQGSEIYYNARDLENVFHPGRQKSPIGKFFNQFKIKYSRNLPFVNIFPLSRFKESQLPK